MFANVTHAPGLVAIESGLLQEELGPDVELEVQHFTRAGGDHRVARRRDRRELHRTQPGDHRLRRVGRRGAAHHLRLDLRAALVVKPEITKVSQLEGKKIATPQLGNTQDVAARAYFASKGLETDVSGGGDVSILPTPNATTLESFKQGLIDGAWCRSRGTAVW